MTSRRFAIFGLSLSSSWGNGHATTWRSLIRALNARGHEVTFYERSQPWYAENRDLEDPDWCRLVFYDSLADLGSHADAICRCDVVMIGSYTPEAILLAQRLRGAAPGLLAFYDIDTPVTVAQMANGACAYLDAQTARIYDLYLSFTGGPFLASFANRTRLAMARALYCSADPDLHRPLAAEKRWDLSYLGTYSGDRQPGLDRLLLKTARALPDQRFVVAGAQYPATIDWPSNVERIEHAPPSDHSSFYSASRFTLNVTRVDMINAGYSPSVRLFEAGACGTPVISDEWRGLEDFFTPGREIFVARRTADVVEFLTRTSDVARQTMGEAARRRVLAAHTAERRAEELECHLTEAFKMIERVGRAELRATSGVS